MDERGGGGEGGAELGRAGGVGPQPLGVLGVDMGRLGRRVRPADRLEGGGKLRLGAVAGQDADDQDVLAGRQIGRRDDPEEAALGGVGEGGQGGADIRATDPVAELATGLPVDQGLDPPDPGPGDGPAVDQQIAGHDRPGQRRRVVQDGDDPPARRGGRRWRRFGPRRQHRPQPPGEPRALDRPGPVGPGGRLAPDCRCPAVRLELGQPELQLLDAQLEVDVLPQ